jgi:hypothetical protein
MAACWLVVVALWVLSWLAVPLLMGPPDGARTFGDMFGAVNALFSGLAFAMLIYTVWMQKELPRQHVGQATGCTIADAAPR